MIRIPGLFLVLSILTACVNAPELPATPPAPTSISTDASPAATPEPNSVTPALTNPIELSTYSLRGHQFSDPQGRYYLETILPGLYSSRPIEHIHVKVQPEGGEVVTSQLYFPAQPIEGLTVQTEDKSDYLLGYFNFVVQR